MLDPKLILIEGLPGSGKSTTMEYLAKLYRTHGQECHAYLEEDPANPIDCLNFALNGLPERMLPLWTRLAAQMSDQPAVTIIESRLWQNTAMYMYMGGCKAEEVLQFSQQVWQAISGLSPVLIYLDQDDTEAALRRLFVMRGSQWVQWALDETLSYAWFQARGLKDFEGWVQFFEEWRDMEDELFRAWPGRKIRVLNAHEDWPGRYGELGKFLEIQNN